MSSKQAIIDLETRFWQTMIDRDIPTAVALMDDTSLVAGAQGVARISGKQFAAMMEHGQWTLHSFAFSDVEVTFPVPTTAVIAYKVSERLTVDGQPLEMEAADCSVWVRKHDQWRCALHTESVLGDPFGRDRSGSPKAG